MENIHWILLDCRNTVNSFSLAEFWCRTREILLIFSRSVIFRDGCLNFNEISCLFPQFEVSVKHVLVPRATRVMLCLNNGPVGDHVQFRWIDRASLEFDEKFQQTFIFRF